MFNFKHVGIELSLKYPRKDTKFSVGVRAQIKNLR